MDDNRMTSSDLYASVQLPVPEPTTAFDTAASSLRALLDPPKSDEAAASGTRRITRSFKKKAAQ